MNSFFKLLFILILSLGLVACNDDQTLQEKVGANKGSTGGGTVSLSGGLIHVSSLTQTVGTGGVKTLKVKAFDSSNSPKSGVTVDFELVDSAGSLSLESTETDESGIASVVFTAPSVTESSSVVVSSELGIVTFNLSVGSSSSILVINPTSITLEVNDSTTFAGLGGTSPYTYTVVSGEGLIDANTGSFTAGANPGNSIIRVVDGSGQLAEAIVRINSVGVVDSDLGISPLSVIVTNNETYTFSATGGATPYTYSVLNGAGTINPATGLYTAPAVNGNATIRVTDATGATSDAGVSVQAALSLTPGTTSVEVNDNLNLVASGGVGTYTFSIHSGGGAVDVNSGVFTAPAGAGSTVVKVTDSNSNTAFSTISVYETLEISDATVSVAETNNFTFTASGGVPPYAYSVPLGAGSIGAATGIFTAPGVSVSTTIVRVTDSIGNISDSVVTTNPDISIEPSSFTMVTSGTKTFTASGGSENYSWSMVSGSGSIDAVTGEYTAPVLNGSAVIRASDSLGNTSTVNITINSSLTISPSTKTVLTNSTRTFTSTGGVPPYTYSVETVGGGDIHPVTGEYTAAAGAGGPYTIRVEDSIGNTSDASINTVTSSTLKITPNAVGINVNDTQSFVATGGTPPYVYSVESGDGIIDANTGEYTAPSTAGSVTVAVTDATDFTVTASVVIYNPAAISGLQAWYDSNKLTSNFDGDLVSNWQDQSGNGCATSQANGLRTPMLKENQINGKSTMRFRFSTNNEQHVYMANCLDAFKNVSGITAFVVHAGHNSGYDRKLLKIATADAANPRFEMALNGSSRRFRTRRLDGDSTHELTGTNLVAYGRFYADVAVMDYANQTASYFVDGSSAGAATGILSPGNSDNTDSTFISIGGDNDGNNETSNSDIAEVLIFNRALDTNERRTIEAYLADKYGLYHPNAIWVTDSGYSAALQTEISNSKLNKEVADDLHTIGIDFFPISHLDAGQIKGINHTTGFDGWYTSITGHNARGNQGLWYQGSVNGLPSVRLGSHQHFTYYNPMINGSAYSLFMVVRADPGVNGTLLQQMNHNPYYSTMVKLNSAAQTLEVIKGKYNAMNNSLSAAATPNQYGLVEIVVGGNIFDIWYNGANNLSATFTLTNVFSNYGTQTSTIGFDSGGIIQGDADFAGNVAEVVVYPYALNDEQRQAVEEYLRVKYNLW